MTHDYLTTMKPINRWFHLRGIPLVWEWPTGQMLWFFWNRGGLYRLGPLTLNLSWWRGAPQ